ncbi:hypothetical protein [Dinoroseobacter sp. S375]|uniref:hypothetical protein n=1 Tax=Dinoroseobacter sp. S375 TaxID=3415136 RepID=UPI003C7A09C0
MTSLILHAGFPKCGSTSIFNAMVAQLPALRARGVRVFNRDLDLPEDPAQLQPPLWPLQQAMESPEAGVAFQARLRGQITAAGPDETLVLSSENLADLRAPARLFAGLDRACDVTVVAYIRPQIDWIPSAWKQWDLKDGLTLEASVQRHLRVNQPNYLRIMRAWRAALPGARIRLRPFLPRRMVRGQPAYDFFALFDWPAGAAAVFTEASNPSVDFALMHFMMRHHDVFFDSRHDARFAHRLTRALPPAYQRPNARMLSADQARRIRDHFLNENFALASGFLDDEDPEHFVMAEFGQIPEGLAYGEMSEAQILRRAHRILSEVFDLPGQDRPLALALRARLMDDAIA